MLSHHQLLNEIAHCSIANAIRSEDSTVSVPCGKIVHLQTGTSFQLPEPWSGQIDTAPLLFISSNPSINELEVYPDESWEDLKTIDFFQSRFTSENAWVVAGRALQRSGSRSRGVAFWGHARNRAREILRREIKPGIDFALTEVVHCKSRKEIGVAEAQNFCSQRYLDKVISVSAAKVLIVYGKCAEAAIRDYRGSVIVPQEHGLSLVSIGGKLRILVFLPHPNNRGSQKTLIANIGDKGLSSIRAHISSDFMSNEQASKSSRTGLPKVTSSD